MWIETRISYSKEGVLSFNPTKIIVRLRDFFPQIETDWKDQTRYWLEKFFQTVKEKNLEPPSFIVEKKWELFSQNAPTLLFKIITDTNTEIKGLTNRWRIEFQSEQQFDTITEKTIVDFLKSINYGETRSDTETEIFRYPHKDFKNNWTLDKPS